MKKIKLLKILKINAMIKKNIAKILKRIRNELINWIQKYEFCIQKK